jgi:protein TonB
MPMRDGANRVLGYAVLASLLLHALVFYVVPAARQRSALVPPDAEPLIARVERLEPPPVPAPAAVPKARKPAPQAPVRVVEPVAAPAPVAEPVAEPAPPRSDPVVLAPQPAPAQPAPAPAAPAPAAPAPPPAIDPRMRSDYAQRINDEAERHKVYPRVAIDNIWQGEVGLVMAIGSDGRIASLRVTKSSGHRVLDDQALEMFARATPRVRVPAALRGREFELELRAVFRLDG